MPSEEPPVGFLALRGTACIDIRYLFGWLDGWNGIKKTEGIIFLPEWPIPFHQAK